MEEAVQGLARQFELRLAELTLLENDLNKKLRVQFAGSKSDPATLLARLRAISREIPVLYDQRRKVDAEKEEALYTLEKHSTANSTRLSRVQDQVRISPQDQVRVDYQTIVPAQRAVVAEEPAPRTAPKAPIEVGLTEEKFNQLSKTVRGRAPYAQVEVIMNLIEQHFTADPSSAPLTIPALSKLGAKVAGQSGTSALNALRSLKLIEMTKAGVTWTARPKNARKKKSRGKRAR